MIYAEYTFDSTYIKSVVPTYCIHNPELTCFRYLTKISSYRKWAKITKQHLNWIVRNIHKRGGGVEVNINHRHWGASGGRNRLMGAHQSRMWTPVFERDIRDVAHMHHVSMRTLARALNVSLMSRRKQWEKRRKSKLAAGQYTPPAA